MITAVEVYYNNELCKMHWITCRDQKQVKCIGYFAGGAYVDWILYYAGGDYVDYLLGDDIGNSIEGNDMEISFDELSDDSDWYMD